MRPPAWMREALEGYRWLWRAHVRWRAGPRWCAVVEFGLGVVGDLGRAALAALEACANPSSRLVPLAVTPTGRSAMTIPHANANDRFKAGFDSWMWISMMAAVLVHFATFAYWPEMSVAVDFKDRTVLEVIPEPVVDIPEAPEPLDHPALPIISAVELTEDVTIGSTDFRDNPIDKLPPPPTDVRPDVARGGDFTPFTVAPRVLNAEEVVRAMRREYPSVLRDAGIGGTVKVLFSIDDDGRVLETSIEAGSGYAALDEAALAVADVIRFSPAMNRDRRVAVRVAFPVVFQVTGSK
jgi:TonB family protein